MLKILKTLSKITLKCTESVSNHCYLTWTCFKKVKHFELFINIYKVRNNLLDYFDTEYWSYNNSELIHFETICNSTNYNLFKHEDLL